MGHPGASPCSNGRNCSPPCCRPAGPSSSATTSRSGERSFHAACEAAGLPGTIARRGGAAYPAAGAPPGEPAAAPDCLRIPSRGMRAPDPAEHLLAGLSRQRAAREAARPLHFTNLDKVFWPDHGYTKGDLIRYYDRVAEHLLPYLHERPSHLLRYPDGVGGKAFYQKDLPDHTPDWIVSEEIPSGHRGETIRYLIVNDAAALLYAANLGSIDIHPWLSRRTRRDTPDWAVFDLDPGGGPFRDVVRLARAFGKVLRGIGLRPCLKTSGATGLHIYVPLEPVYPYEVVRQFAEAVSTHVAGEHRDIATVERTTSRRRGRVYLDFLQNRRGADRGSSLRRPSGARGVGLGPPRLGRTRRGPPSRALHHRHPARTTRPARGPVRRRPPRPPAAPPGDPEIPGALPALAARDGSAGLHTGRKPP